MKSEKRLPIPDATLAIAAGSAAAYVLCWMYEVGGASQLGVPTTLNNIGGVYHAQGLYEQALEYYQAALLIARDLGLSSLEKTVMHNMEDLP